jgi:trehalose 6-phosphate synthase
VIANPLLWFVQHGLWDLSNAPNLTAAEFEAFERGYRAVNEAFADAVAELLGPPRGGRPPIVMAHDYHLYLLGAAVRRRRPEAFLHHFVHVPWPQPDTWRTLPKAMREPLFEGLLGNDVVAFHTERFARNFLLTCAELLDLPVDEAALSVEAPDGRTVAARWYPISVDAAYFDEVAESEEVLAHEAELERLRRDHLILRVDRADLSKNVLRGFLAFDLLLDEHPELAGRVTFLALLQPSRQDVEQYIEYMERIHRLAADINLKHGTTDWQPIDLRVEDNFAQAVAAYRLFDVLLVNPVSDGMNLVAKEGMLVNRRDGVLVLSEHAGVHDELGAFALSVHPIDIAAQAEALYRALTMDHAERRERRRACVEVVRENDLGKWLRVQLEDVDQLCRLASTPADAGRIGAEGARATCASPE